MRKILLVEDDPKVARAMQVRLKHSGYTVILASDVPQAMMLARKQDPDVAVLDISLPGGNGIQLAQNLQDLFDDRLLPVVFVTASKEERLKEEASQLHATAFLEKPFAANKLLEAIDTALMGDSEEMRVAYAVPV